MGVEVRNTGGSSRSTAWWALAGSSCALVAALAAAQPGQPLRWHQIGPDGGSVVALVPVPDRPGAWLAAVEGGGVYRSLDNGLSWRPPTGDPFRPPAVERDPPGAVTLSVSRRDPRLAWLVVKDAGLYRSADGGGRWALVTLVESDRTPSASLLAAVTVDPWRTDGVYVADRDGVFHSDDGGASWQGGAVGLLDRFGEPVRIFSLAADPHRLDRLLLGTSDGIFSSADRGATWRLASASLPMLWATTALVFSPLAPNAVFALGSVSSFGPSPFDCLGVVRSEDGGDTWKYGIACLGADSALAVSEDGRTVVASGWRHFLVSLDGGVTWQAPIPGPSTGIVRSVALDPWRPGRALVGAEGVASTSDGGATWTQSSTGLAASRVKRLRAGAGGTSLIAAIEAQSARRLTVATSTWGAAAPLDFGDGSTGWWEVTAVAADPTDPLVAYAGGLYTGVQRTRDGGETWTDVSSDDLPSGETRLTVYDLETDPSRPARVYAASSLGVLRSADSGWGWEVRYRSLPGAPLRLAIDPRRSEVLWCGTAYEVYRSGDDGAHWTRTLDSPLPDVAPVEALAIAPSDPRTVYVSFNGEGVFVTNNDGSGWRRTGSSPPIECAQVTDTRRTCTAVNALAVDPDDARTVYAATAAGLFRTSDGGGSWQPFGEGVSCADVRDVVVVGSTGWLYAATYGGGVFARAPQRPPRRRLAVRP